ncbi:lipase [Streptomyces sp. NPDC005474]|uniref:alpha/beta hydrolase family protein n=1 Tax=Streptomyces sp. NPDC005474 TaxID=3154878 RepID=UPI003455C36C
MHFEPPSPTGPYQIGTVALHLVDSSRTDPWVAGHQRELMINVWYPARTTAGYPLAPWMQKAAADRYLSDLGIPGRVVLGATDGHQGAPADHRLGRLPVVLYSPGANASRSYGTGVVEELASHGYAVVTMDHTYDAAVVEFPDGRVVTNPKGEITDFVKAAEVRAADTRFVLDQLSGRKLPAKLTGLLDMNRIGMFGHSLGGASTSWAMYTDKRIKAGLGLDGAVLGPVAKAGLGRPYLVVDTPGKGGMDTNPMLQMFWKNLRGFRLNLTLKGAAHNSFGDDVRLLRKVGLSKEELEDYVGTIPEERALAFQRAYPLAFFDRFLRGKKSPLLDGPTPCFPEVAYTR